MSRKSLEDIIEAAEGGAVVVTVNKRLARYLSARYEASMHAGGRAAWTSPVIMPLYSWVKSLLEDSWQEGRAALITEARAAALWKKIIEGDKVIAGREVLLAGGAWRAAYNAYGLMKEYCQRSLGDEIYLGEEALAFKRWSRKYEEELKRLGYMDRSELLDVVTCRIKKGPSPEGCTEMVLPNKVVFAGFDDMTPQRAAFVRALEEAGTEVDCWPHEPSAIADDEAFLPDDAEATVEVRSFKNRTDEVKSVARWLRKVAAPGIRVGVIVPELDRYREVILREFSAELSPSSVLPRKKQGGTADVSQVFNISLGSPLAGEPLVKGALDLLSFGLWDEDISRIGHILLSPFIASSEEERLELAALDAKLKDKKILKIRLRELRKKCENETGSLKVFAGRLDRWIELLEKDKARALPSIWAERFSSLLTALGWQGGGESSSKSSLSLTSREYQTLESWKALLSEFAALGDIVGVISRKDAVARIRSMAAEKIFQMETTEVGIEVLGLLEASGQDFDHVWLMGAHGDALPGHVSANPFIPIELQRRFGMPRSTPEIMLGFARNSLKRIFQSGKSFVVSSPLEVEGKEIGLSPLLVGLPLRSKAASGEDKMPQGSSLKAAVHESCVLEDMPDEVRLPLDGEELKGLKGGTSVIKDQLECPFKAFALHRLGARTAALPEEGLDAGERGSIVHKVLELFWREVKTSARLKELKDAGELKGAIDRVTAEALKGFYEKRLPRQLIVMEGERVSLLVAQWLELELGRAPFKVEQTEFNEDVLIGGLRIVTRLDRVDTLENGAKVVIDYKTGDCKKNAWKPDELTEPQMLLYDIGSGFDAIAFASLKLSKTRFIGITKDAGMLPDVKSLDEDSGWRKSIEGVEDWEDLKDRWREALTTIAEKFVEGRNEVEPRKKKVCDFCELPIFCRIFEADTGNYDEQEEADNG